MPQPPEPQRLAVRVRALAHRYPGADRLALDDVSLTVRAGERLGLLGPNGAGKSTLMRLLCGFLPVASRADTQIELSGFDVRTQSRAARASVGYLPEHVPLYPELRAREHLAFRAAIKGVPRRRRAAEIDRVAQCTGIGHVLGTPIGKLSRGYRQRVGVADALLGAPPVVILDEPTVGLDPNQVREVRAMLRELGGAHTLIFSSHILAEVEMLCDRVVILSEGRVVADEALAQATAAQHVVVAWQGDEAAARAVLARVWTQWGIEPEPRPAIEVDGECCRARLELPAAVPSATELLASLGRAAVEQGVALVELRPGRTRLEERFAEVTGARAKPQGDADDEAEADASDESDGDEADADEADADEDEARDEADAHEDEADATDGGGVR